MLVERRQAAPWAMVVAGCWAGACGLAPPSPAAAASETGARGLTVMVFPDDDSAPILEAVRSARRRVWVEMYLLTALDAVAALVQARAGGLDVRVLLEPAPYGEEGANQPAFDRLTAAGVDVRWTHRAVGLVHAKLLLIDGRSAWVMTLNLTISGLHHNREYAVIDRDPEEVRRAEAIFSADGIGVEPAGGRPDPGSRALLVSPLNTRARLGACVSAARGSIVVEMEELSDSELVAGLAAAVSRGVMVSVVAPATGRSQATTVALRKLAAAGVVVRLLASPPVHGKAMVVDGRQVYVGSVNFTRASLDDNREVGLLWTDSAAAARVSAAIASDIRAGSPLADEAGAGI